MGAKTLKAAVVCTLLAILLGMPLLPTPHRIRPSTFEQITLGMKKIDVERLLGRPPGEYDGFELREIEFDEAAAASRQNRFVWCSRSCSIIIYLDDDGAVDEAVLYYSDPRTLWGRIMQRFSPSDELTLVRIKSRG